MRTIAHYRVTDRRLFERTVAPYVYGSGEHAPASVTNARWHDDGAAALDVTAASVSQLVTATIGMLRFAPGSMLERIEVLEAMASPIRDPFSARAVIGAILKPALADVKAHERVVERAIEQGFDFVKDDDVTECSTERIARITRACGNHIVYFRKIATAAHFSNNPTMVIPWIDGWPLAEHFSNSFGVPVLIHPANTPTTLSWEAHITFGRLAGASAVVVPDTQFDATVDIDTMLRAAIAPNGNTPPIRLLLAGGITPQRIEEIKRMVDPDAHRHLGFTIGSWLTRTQRSP